MRLTFPPQNKTVEYKDIALWWCCCLLGRGFFAVGPHYSHVENGLTRRELVSAATASDGAPAALVRPGSDAAVASGCVGTAVAQKPVALCLKGIMGARATSIICSSAAAAL